MKYRFSITVPVTIAVIASSKKDGLDQVWNVDDKTFRDGFIYFINKAKIKKTKLNKSDF